MVRIVPRVLFVVVKVLKSCAAEVLKFNVMRLSSLRSRRWRWSQNLSTRPTYPHDITYDLPLSSALIATIQWPRQA